MKNRHRSNGELSAPRRRLIGAFGEGYAKFFFCPQGKQYRGGEDKFRSADPHRESLARFGPPGVR